MKINQAGIDLIKAQEGCILHAYKDIKGIPTIGYGHIEGVEMGQEITQEEAEQLLVDDLPKYEEGVSTLVKVPLNENQFAALVSFCYNLGIHALAGSTLLKLLNEEHYDLAANEFHKWDHAGPKEVSGLLKRRLAERDLFLTPV